MCFFGYWVGPGRSEFGNDGTRWDGKVQVLIMGERKGAPEGRTGQVVASCWIRFTYSLRDFPFSFCFLQIISETKRIGEYGYMYPSRDWKSWLCRYLCLSMYCSDILVWVWERRRLGVWLVGWTRWWSVNEVILLFLPSGSTWLPEPLNTSQLTPLLLRQTGD